MFILFFALLSVSTMAEDFIVEKTYPRDNTFCNMQKKRMEFQLRSSSRFSDGQEKFGECAFFINKEQYELLPINKDRMDSYEFFHGTGSLCTKSHGYEIDADTLALLFLKENKPFPGKLTIQLFDVKNGKPKELVETQYLTDKAIKYPKGFAFSLKAEKLEVENGKVTIDKVLYLYQNRSMTPWMGYSLAGFETLPTLTCKKSEWKRFFKNEKEFLEGFSWQEKEKVFQKTILYIAFNHGVKKKCILPVTHRQPINGLEKWYCR